jgi:hypothetical protein
LTTDHDGFVAEKIGAFSVGKTVFAFTPKESSYAMSVGSTSGVMPVEVL